MKYCWPFKRKLSCFKIHTTTLKSKQTNLSISTPTFANKLGPYPYAPNKQALQENYFWYCVRSPAQTVFIWLCEEKTLQQILSFISNAKKVSCYGNKQQHLSWDLVLFVTLRKCGLFNFIKKKQINNRIYVKTQLTKV